MWDLIFFFTFFSDGEMALEVEVTSTTGLLIPPPPPAPPPPPLSERVPGEQRVLIASINYL